jgi:acetyl-CoA C-acetyltransferase
MSQTSAYIIAARRTALGRIGGLHRNRRIAELAAPVVRAALEDCGLAPERVDELIAGNATEGGNPARLIALAAGLSDTAPAATIDRQCASGLDAILVAIRAIGAGEADVIVAGGGEAISTAPWRIAKPKSLYQLPHFMTLEPTMLDSPEELLPYEASEEYTRKLGISRARQDAYALHSYLRAEAARSAKRFIGEIVPLRANADEARDQSAVEPALEELERLSPYVPPDGTLTPGNTSALHDGAAFAVIVSERVWTELGKPRALRLVASAAQGVAPEEEAGAPIEVMKKLLGRMNGVAREDISLIEMSESSAAQAIALSERLELDIDRINPDGGALVRGHPFGAAGAVLVVRLFTSMVRANKGPLSPRYGVVTLGAIGGMGLAALFEAV